MIKLSIIIPVFNGIEYTKKCLNYLKDTLSPVNNEEFQSCIVVVDDGSTDGSSEWIKNNYPEVIICQGDGNLWWSGGINMGIHHAIEVLKTDYILLWNNDIRPAKDYFVQLSDMLVSNPFDNIILSTIFIENRSKKIICSLGGNFNSVTGNHSLIGIGKEAESFISPDLEINWFPGMGTIIHKSVFDKIGFFDAKNFPQYKGDADFGLRASKAGYKLSLSSRLELWNDRDNTGFSNNKSWQVFIKSLVSKKSNTNIYRDILFYHRHGKSILVYGELFRKYFAHIGGFFKWKLLGLFGFKRKLRY
jgi:GT2 family glycosyltransferase